MYMLLTVSFLKKDLVDEIAIKKIEKSPIKKIITTNTNDFTHNSSLFNVLSVGVLLSEVIRRQCLNESLTDINYRK